MPYLHKLIKLHLLLGVAIVVFSSCQKRYLVSDHSVNYYRIDKKIAIADQEMVDFIQPYREGLNKEMNQVIGYSKVELIKEKPESNMGNFIVDALMEKGSKLGLGNIDFATQNYGGLRRSEIGAGPITNGSIFELMPFENFLVLVEVPGASLMEFFDRIARYGGWPVSSNVMMTIKEGQLMEVLLNDERINDEKLYRVLMPDYIANGGDNCSFFEGKRQINTGILIRDVLIGHVKELDKEGRSIESKIEGRIINLEN